MNRIVRTITVVLALVGAASLGTLAVKGVAHRLPDLSGRLAVAAPEPAQAPAAQVRPATGEAAQPVAVRACDTGLETAMLLADGRHLRDVRVALPVGSRFRLRLNADRDGMVEVWNLDPTGRQDAVAVWRGRLQARVAVVTPAMHLLAGSRSSDLLYVVFRPSDDLETCGRAARTLEVTHL